MKASPLLQTPGSRTVGPIAGGRRATVSDAWHALGLPGSPDWACCSPFNGTGEVAFMVLADGRTWFDFDQRDQGGLTRFLERALGVGRGEALWLVRELEAEVAYLDSVAAAANAAPRPYEGEFVGEDGDAAAKGCRC